MWSIHAFRCSGLRAFHRAANSPAAAGHAFGVPQVVASASFVLSVACCTCWSKLACMEGSAATVFAW